MGVGIGINGFGRMGRLALRAAWDWPELDVRARQRADRGDAATAAHLLTFDSVHGRWSSATSAARAETLAIDGAATVGYSGASRSRARCRGASTGVDVVLECSRALPHASSRSQPYFGQGVRKVIVAAPVKDAAALNVVIGVNDDRYDPARHDILTAASCTTNCLAPVVKVIHEGIGIRHGPDHDAARHDQHPDGRRRPAQGSAARDGPPASSLIPTTTGSATAIGLIFPELEGRLNGLAVRVPLLNASLTDCVFEVARADRAPRRSTGCSRPRPRGPLAGILGYEERPLVSVDYRDDPRSGDRRRALDDGRSTARRSRSSPGTTTSGATPTASSSWPGSPPPGWCPRATAAARSQRRSPARGSRRSAQLRRSSPGAYWADTLADGATRMLVLFYFYERGYSPVRGRVAVPLLRDLRRSSRTSSAAGSRPASG